MSTIGILYIATGPYIAFWKGFYESFEKFFLPHTEKHYFVFTDNTDFAYKDNARVHTIFQKSEPWPLATLLKFHRFLEVEEELVKYDFLYQSNGPIVCCNFVEETVFLPDKGKGEKLFFTLHPGFWNRSLLDCPYERRSDSKASVLYHEGQNYVFGAMNGGYSSDYLNMCRDLKLSVEQDLAQGIVAKWHDESHINRWIVGRKDYKLLPFSYAYPDGLRVPGDKIIACVNKSDFFDVNEFKYSKISAKESEKKLTFGAKAKRRIDYRLKKFEAYIKPRIGYIKESIFRK